MPLDRLLVHNVNKLAELEQFTDAYTKQMVERKAFTKQVAWFVSCHTDKVNDDGQLELLLDCSVRTNQMIHGKSDDEIPGTRKRWQCRSK